MLMYGRSQHNSVKQLSFNKKINQFKVKKNVYIAINAIPDHKQELKMR